MERQKELFENPALLPYILRNVKRPEDKPNTLGAGSYGTVELLDINGVPCAGKLIHNSLIDGRFEGAGIFVEKFVQECDLMGKLRHPHIVQFLGLCVFPESALPVLVMEYLTTSLAALLMGNADIPLYLKLSFLYDVVSGLGYLHCCDPPVIHRDLTARNVLLNSAMVAKIADFGNSRIIDISPEQLAKSMTCAPGTPSYLPPEAMEPGSKYDAKLDIFSFGHLALYTITRVFPMPIASTYVNPDGKVVGRTEVERRQEHVDRMRATVGEVSSLGDLVIQCLNNDPERRPLATELLQKVGDLRTQIPDPYEHLTKLDVIKLKMIGVNTEKDTEKPSDGEESQLPVKVADTPQPTIAPDTKLLQTKDRALEAMEAETRAQAAFIQEKQEQLELKERVVQANLKCVKAMEEEMQAKDQIIQAKEMEVSAKSKVVDAKEAEVEHLSEELAAMRLEVERLQSQVSGLEQLCQNKDGVIEAKSLECREQAELFGSMETSQSRTAVLDHDDLKRKEEEVDQLREKIKIHEQEISGFERLCQAKDKLLVAKEVEQLQLEETIRQRLLEELQTLEKVGGAKKVIQVQELKDMLNTTPQLPSTTVRKASDQDSEVSEVGSNQPQESYRHIKAMFIGDGATGKTCMLIAYSTDQFPEGYVPTIFDNYAVQLMVDGKPVQVGLWDTAGQDDYDRLRPLSYPDTDVVVICFAVDRRGSFENVKDQWCPEAAKFMRKAPVILVALKKDLRNNPYTIEEMARRKQAPITTSEGEKLAKDIGCVGYYECSAKTREGLDSVFNAVVSAATDQSVSEAHKRKQCIIL